MNELLRDEDDVLLNFSEGTVRVKRGYFSGPVDPCLRMSSTLPSTESGVG